MSARQEAIMLDREDRPVEAAEAYERAIMENDASLDTFLNLAVLYFECTDGGYAAQHRLPNEFMRSSFERANDILTKAEARFGKHPEIDFWRYYFKYVVLGDEHFVDACRRLAQSSSSLVPYFYLFPRPGGLEYRREAEELLNQVREGLTAKDRYIRSILQPRLEPRWQPRKKRPSGE